MKCVAYTLLLCFCVVVTSHAQNGIHITKNGNVGIGDETPYSRLTLSGTVGYHNGTFPLNYMFESGETHPLRALFAYSPEFPSKGFLYDDQTANFTFGDGIGGIWFNMEDPAIGIGVPDPFNSLIVAGNSATTPAILRLGNKGGFDQVNSGALIFDEDVEAALGSQNFCGIAMRYNGLTNTLEYLGDCTDDTDLDNAQLIMSVARDGNVGFGSAPDSMYRVQVAGHVRAEEIVVETGWADYVFEHDYKLRSLEQVDEYIATNGHLPGIPSASEVETKGLEVGDMSRLFMEKIEELTLYTISQNQKLKEQQAIIDELIAQTKSLRAELDDLQASKD